MLQVVLAISGLKSRLPVTLKLDVARAPEIRVGIGFGQQARVIVIVTVIRPSRGHLSELYRHDPDGLDRVAVVTGAALVKRGVLQQKVNR